MIENFISHYTTLQKAILREILLQDYERFCKFAFRCLYGKNMSVEPHHKILCKVGQDVIDGKRSKVIISLPPRHSKTLTFNVFMIARSYAGYGGSNNIQASASKKALKKNARDIITILQHPAFQELFGVKIASEAIEEFTTTDNGTCINSPAKGGVTGLGAGVKGEEGFTGGLFLDDMLDAGNARSKAKIEEINDLYVEKFSNRLNNPSTPVVVIMQRLNDDDLSGFLLKGNKGKQWHYINVPAIMTEECGTEEWYGRLCKDYSAAKPIYYNIDIPALIERNLEQEFSEISEETDWIRDKYSCVEDYKDDELSKRLKGGKAALWAQTVPLSEHEYTYEVNRQYFLTQYMGEATGAQGTVFKEEWFQWYDGFHTLDEKDIKTIRIYVDSAMKTNSWNDYSVFTAWALTNQGNIYLIDGMVDKWEAPELQENFEVFYERIKNLKPSSPKYRWRLECAKVEDMSSGTGLIQASGRKSGFNVLPIKRNKDKYSRASEVAPELHAGKVFLPKGMTVSQRLKDEAIEFTSTDSHKHDDIVDTMMDAIQDLLIDNSAKIKRVGLGSLLR